ncbi:hypothetical protein SDRG_01900 [Saprolegnia diclina VS20]|uniref:Endonuclease/exonuclease/phosphatase domain-containing protein n=1 Tax=Saprolegnia diclina (strain VS20) TaxID=1156394 RepID=T0S6N6_SAPDV|nr:hypothetical protein SDRG_01900 [Saprolegnia diclina VS20]EQC40833.1 hypothetical protein SDRG_01900 [Saprolegnia diclina VS20]|eukprot:XP_008605677.1 hypothetical protein SDRG_01900 [Saprolegnia diclina VS20]
MPFVVSIDINTASSADLRRVPGVGLVLSERIIAHRPYSSVDALVYVPGIGVRSFAKMRPWLTPLAPRLAPAVPACELSPVVERPACHQLRFPAGEPTYAIASWNLCNLSKKRSTDSLRLIAEIFAPFDLVALQEVRDTLVLKKLRALLRGWDYVLSARVGGTTHGEYFAFFYRKTKWLRPTVLPLADNHDGLDALHRCPFVVQANSMCRRLALTLVNVHIVFGHEAGRRKREVDGLVALAAGLPGKLVLLGDFNLPPFDLGLTSARWLPLINAPLTTTIGNNLYDNLWVRDTTGTVGDFALCAGVDRVDQRYFPATKQRAAAKAARLQCCSVLSDHCPVYMALYAPSELLSASP